MQRLLLFLLLCLGLPLSSIAQSIDFGKVKLGTSAKSGVNFKVPIRKPFTCAVRIDSEAFHSNPTMNFSLGGGGNSTVDGYLEVTFTPRRPGRSYGFAILDIPELPYTIQIPLSGFADSAVPSGVFAEFWRPDNDYLTNTGRSESGTLAENVFSTSAILYCLPFSSDTLIVSKIAGMKSVYLSDTEAKYRVAPGNSIHLTFSADTTKIGYTYNDIQVTTNALNLPMLYCSVITQFEKQPELYISPLFDTIFPGTESELHIGNIGGLRLELNLPELQWPFRWGSDGRSYTLLGGGSGGQYLLLECAETDSNFKQEYWIKTNAANFDDSVKLTLVTLQKALTGSTTKSPTYTLRIGATQFSFISIANSDLKLYDALGRIVHHSLNVTSVEWMLKGGIYFLEIDQDGKKELQKFVVE